jgi:hypothetical protein
MKNKGAPLLISPTRQSLTKKGYWNNKIKIKIKKFSRLCACVCAFIFILNFKQQE